MKVQIRLLNLKGRYGYDVAITDPQATVADYLQAVEGLATVEGLARLRNPGGKCYGCPLCCAERIPLTSIDALNLAAAVGEGRDCQGLLRRWQGERALIEGEPSPGRRAVPRKEKRGGEPQEEGNVVSSRSDEMSGEEVLKVVRRYGWVAVWGRVVDITLRQHSDGTCVLLDSEEGLCRYYAERPLVCRTYFCCPITTRARLLREFIVNQGQDELVRLLLQQAGRDNFPVNEANNFDLRPADWPQNAFTNRRDYREIPLKEVLPARLWRRLLSGQ